MFVTILISKNKIGNCLFEKLRVFIDYVIVNDYDGSEVDIRFQKLTISLNKVMINDEILIEDCAECVNL
jgi:hypothetical protein